MIKIRFMAVIASFLMLTGCGSYAGKRSAVTMQSDSSSVMMQSDSSATVTFETNGNSDIEYTAQDVRNLSDYLLAKPTAEDLRGTPYDLDNDGVWSFFDLCLMKRKILEQRNMTTEFDLENKTVLLNSGYEMPIIGLGTWTQDDDTAENSVYEALKDGYRLIDTAQYYGNETGVGKGIRKAIDEGIVTREEVFVTTKVMPSNYDRAYKSIDDSLERLGLDYIDLMLIHQSGSNDTEVYKALCQGVRDGKLRSIGISNYYTLDEYERVTSGSEIKPAVVQNENHPFYQNTEFQKDIAKYGTVVESWYPFGGRGHTQDLFGNETITDIAKVHGKTSAQIILRWHLQAGYVTIPGSQNPDHILENYSIFDFELTDAEMQRMAELHTGQRYENW
jgi:diketogulonate reductase-like aldo/keto reductase